MTASYSVPSEPRATGTMKIHARLGGVTENPAAGTPKRPEDEPGQLEIFTVEEVEAIARAAESGIWRTARTHETPAIEAALRLEDRQLADLIRIAAYTGLRRG